MTNKYQETALHLATMAGHAEVVRVLCEHGADVNAQDEVCVPSLSLSHSILPSLFLLLYFI
jgi:ankyrin repeat protein